MNPLNVFFENIIKGSLYFLLSWYFVSLYVVMQDITMSFGMTLAFETINCLMIIMLSRVILFQYSNPGFTDFCLSFSMIFWFFYSTYRDYTEQGYTIFLKLFYVGIDLLSMLFLIDTFINFMLSSGFFIMTAEQIKKTNFIVKIGLGTCFTFAFLGLMKEAK